MVLNAYIAINGNSQSCEIKIISNILLREDKYLDVGVVKYTHRNK